MNFTLHAADRFPVGTTVSAYHALQLPPRLSGLPSGLAVTSAVVAADSSLTFTGLTDRTDYFAYANVAGADVYVTFRADDTITGAPTELVNVSSAAPGAGSPGQVVVVRSDGTIGYVDDSVQVAAWGAKFDGVTDDTAAWQAALNVGKRHVHAASGTSIISADLTVPSGRYVDGEGMGASTVKRTGSTAGKVFTNADQASFGADADITICDLTVDRTAGATGNSPYDDCIHMRYVDGVTVQRVRARGGMKGIHLEGCDSGLVTGCRLTEFHDNGVAINDAAGFGGVNLTEPEIVVSHNRLRQTAATIDPGGSSPIIALQDGTQIIGNAIVATAALGGNGIEVGAGTGGVSDGMVVQGNKLSGCAILIGGVSGAQVVANRLRDGQVAGSAAVQAAALGGVLPDHPQILDNTINGNGAGIKVATGVPYAKVGGNYVYGGAPVYVQGDDAEVCGNTVIGALGNGIIVQTCARPVVKWNTVRNPHQNTLLNVDNANGYLLDTLTNPTIEHNVATSTDGNMAYGFYLNAGTGISWHRNKGLGQTIALVRTTGTQTYRDMGSLTAPAFPATAVAAANTTGVDLVAYIANGTGVISQIAIGGTNTNMQIAASGWGAVLIPAGQTITFTYASGTPTWTWQAV